MGGAGYEHPVDQVVEDLLSCLDDPALALLQWNEAFGVVQVRCWVIMHQYKTCASKGRNNINEVWHMLTSNIGQWFEVAWQS